MRLPRGCWHDRRGAPESWAERDAGEREQRASKPLSHGAGRRSGVDVGSNIACFGRGSSGSIIRAAVVATMGGGRRLPGEPIRPNAMCRVGAPAL
jgi:hypothetical protein